MQNRFEHEQSINQIDESEREKKVLLLIIYFLFRLNEEGRRKSTQMTLTMKIN